METQLREAVQAQNRINELTLDLLAEYDDQTQARLDHQLALMAPQATSAHVSRAADRMSRHHRKIHEIKDRIKEEQRKLSNLFSALAAA